MNSVHYHKGEPRTRAASPPRLPSLSQGLIFCMSSLRQTTFLVFFKKNNTRQNNEIYRNHCFRTNISFHGIKNLVYMMICETKNTQLVWAVVMSIKFIVFSRIFEENEPNEPPVWHSTHLTSTWFVPSFNSVPARLLIGPGPEPGPPPQLEEQSRFKWGAVVVDRVGRDEFTCVGAALRHQRAAGIWNSGQFGITQPADSRSSPFSLSRAAAQTKSRDLPWRGCRSDDPGKAENVHNYAW